MNISIFNVEQNGVGPWVKKLITVCSNLALRCSSEIASHLLKLLVLYVLAKVSYLIYKWKCNVSSIFQRKIKPKFNI